MISVDRWLNSYSYFKYIKVLTIILFCLPAGVYAQDYTKSFSAAGERIVVKWQEDSG